MLVFEFPVLGFRWYLIIKQKNNVRFLAHLKLYFIANFFNTFTPAQIGGDVYRLYGLWKKEIDTISKEAQVLLLDGTELKGKVLCVDNNGDLVLKTKNDNQIIKAGMVKKLTISK